MTHHVEKRRRRRAADRWWPRLRFGAFVLLAVATSIALNDLHSAIHQIQANRRESLIRVCQANNVQNDAITVILSSSMSRHPNELLPKRLLEAIDQLRPVPDCEGYADRLIRHGN